MAVVCRDIHGPGQLMTTADNLQREMQGGISSSSSFGSEQLTLLSQIKIEGIVTYTNVIERILCVEINDEKDLS